MQKMNYRRSSTNGSTGSSLISDPENHRRSKNRIQKWVPRLMATQLLQNNFSKSIIQNGFNRRASKWKGSLIYLCVITTLLILYTFITLQSFKIFRQNGGILLLMNTTISDVPIKTRDPQMFLRQIQAKVRKKKNINILPLTVTSSGIQSNTNDTLTSDDCYIIYDATIGGQGTGNLISGLLAAHLLGQEFNRIVCVNPQYYSSFLNAFESVDPTVLVKCPVVINYINGTSSVEMQHSISIINFAGAADECELQNLMSDRTKKVIHLMSNTYPRWPPIPDYYFLHYYQPTKVLFDILPYISQPEIVVHLREPDEVAIDPRRGLDDSSLTALAELLPKAETYLVTNNVEYYDRFAKCCNWTNPKWDGIKHSAIERIWGDTNQVDYSQETQDLRMWSDWYTILMAGTVYHTHSDFSVSAIHWMNNTNSYSIKGYNTDTKKLETTVESWWYDGETIPLNERTLDGKTGTTNELRACSEESLAQTAQREQQRAAVST
jgi:hypothetical protein